MSELKQVRLVPLVRAAGSPARAQLTIYGDPRENHRRIVQQEEEQSFRRRQQCSSPDRMRLYTAELKRRMSFQSPSRVVSTAQQDAFRRAKKEYLSQQSQLVEAERKKVLAEFETNAKLRLLQDDLDRRYREFNEQRRKCSLDYMV